MIRYFPEIAYDAEPVMPLNPAFAASRIGQSPIRPYLIRRAMASGGHDARAPIAPPSMPRPRNPAARESPGHRIRPASYPRAMGEACIRHRPRMPRHRPSALRAPMADAARIAHAERRHHRPGIHRPRAMMADGPASSAPRLRPARRPCHRPPSPRARRGLALCVATSMLGLASSLRRIHDGLACAQRRHGCKAKGAWRDGKKEGRYAVGPGGGIVSTHPTSSIGF